VVRAKKVLHSSGPQPIENHGRDEVRNNAELYVKAYCKTAPNGKGILPYALEYINDAIRYGIERSASIVAGCCILRAIRRRETQTNAEMAKGDYGTERDAELRQAYSNEITQLRKYFDTEQFHNRVKREALAKVEREEITDIHDYESRLGEIEANILERVNRTLSGERYTSEQIEAMFENEFRVYKRNKITEEIGTNAAEAKCQEVVDTLSDRFESEIKDKETEFGIDYETQLRQYEDYWKYRRAGIE